MQSIIDLIHAHPTYAALIAAYLGSAFVSSLEAPTAQSSSFYKFFFKFTNAVAANISRARSTTIEASPNWIPAVEQHVAARGIILDEKK